MPDGTVVIRQWIKIINLCQDAIINTNKSAVGAEVWHVGTDLTTHPTIRSSVYFWPRTVTLINFWNLSLANDFYAPIYFLEVKVTIHYLETQCTLYEVNTVETFPTVTRLLVFG